VLKNMHHSINREEIKTQIEKLGHTVTNICNIKQDRTKRPSTHQNDLIVNLIKLPDNRLNFIELPDNRQYAKTPAK
jgi:hypothetical protein